MFIKLFAITALLLFSLPLLADTLYIYDSRESGYSQKVGEAFRAKGFAVETVGSDDLKNLSGSGRDVLAVIGSDRFPAEANKAFGEFIKNGNGWFGIGGLPFSAPTYALDGSYLTEEELKKAAAERATHTAVSFNRETCSSFKISDSEGIGDARLSSEETEEGNALHISAPAVRSWEQYALKSLPDGAFSDGSMLVFRAKGDADTKEVWLGFNEADGSRWYRRLPLTEEYTEFMLEAGHFRFWNDPPVKGRGEEGDSLKFSNIKEMEMAFMTSAPVTGTPQNVYITDIRTAPAFDPVGFGALPVMEAVYPHNMMWSTDAVTAVKAADGTEAACSETVYTPLWRNQGFGQKYAGKYRQIPLAFCYEGESLRGIAAQVLINYEESEAPGSAWAYIGNSPGFLEKNPGYAETLLSKIASLFAGEARLVNAGTSAFSYLPKDKVKAGFTAVAGAASKNRVSVAVRDGAGNLIREQTKTVSFKPGKKVSAGISAAGLAPGLYEAETVLYSAEGDVQDRLLQKFSVFDENSRNESNVVAARDGNFWVDGRIWVPWGTNYWPLYSSGRESSDYFGITWLFPEQYNPTLIEQDMALLKSINANCISIQYTKEPEADALRDLLERLKQFDIKVHLYLNGCHPLYYQPEVAEKLVKLSLCAKSPSMFSYDLGWEVNCGNHGSRKRFDDKWNKWITENYGSFEEAFRQWGYTPAVEDGFYTNPSDDMIKEPDDKYLAYVAAYRSFLDDHISKGYQRVVTGLRKLDSYTLMGARSGYGGTGASWIAHMFPFDLKSGVRHLDYTAPEAYNIGGSREGFLRGQLNNIYGHFVSHGKPVVWPEYGSPLFNGLPRAEYKPHCGDDILEKEGLYYKGMGEFLAETHVNGGLSWWFPGGYRNGEASDFGIFNPDNTIRPASEAIRDTAAAVKKGYRDPKPFPDVVLKIDRDKYVQGYAGIFEGMCDEVAKLTMEGKRVDLETDGTAAVSSSVPLLCPGNIPYKGKGPLKYLKAEFDEINVNGKSLIESGKVTVKKGKPVVFKVRVANTEEAAWNSPSGYGQVGLRVRYGDRDEFYPIISDTFYLSTATLHTFTLKGNPGEVTLRMSAQGIGDFGETAVITLDYK